VSVSQNIPSENMSAFNVTDPGARPSQVVGPNGNVADSLDEAKAAFRAAWERIPIAGVVLNA
jgi:hypothetical protein